MSNFNESDFEHFDTTVVAAWTDFRTCLADRLAALPKGEKIVLTCSYDVIYPLPEVVFTVTGANRVRCEIPAGPRLRFMETADLDAMFEAGWKQRKDGRVVLEFGRRYSDKLAALAVVVVRDMWEVPHPAFLTEGGPAEPEPIVAVAPRGRDHLQELAAAVVSDLVSEPVLRDEDGDIPLTIGDMSSLLCVRVDEPTIAFYAVLGDATNAAAVLEEHSQVWPDVNLRIVDDAVVGVLRLEATVFVAKNLESAFAKWIHFMREGAPVIASELEVDNVAQSLPAALQCLLHLDQLDASEVAAICDNDRDSILEYLLICSEQEISWRRSASDALDAEEAAACEHEAEAWANTHESLRAALRVVVLPSRRGNRRRDAGWTSEGSMK
ncbi:hypothetical protein [Antrihabitans sp. YC2-6]|uniref:TY-Chap domain-containing protein n=1 Tax=Antrihabitans sp. YC2-6 TaxID=2799498 RepID=UPI0018F5565E|nr:hypothetical protein [Antrihabitans sp. YC2-6]MBJ8347886.1 hypothetical protein [Antrihabitans sp. YC2-6]